METLNSRSLPSFDLCTLNNHSEHLAHCSEFSSVRFLILVAETLSFGYCGSLEFIFYVLSSVVLHVPLRSICIVTYTYLFILSRKDHMLRRHSLSWHDCHRYVILSVRLSRHIENHSDVVLTSRRIYPLSLWGHFYRWKLSSHWRPLYQGRWKQLFFLNTRWERTESTVKETRQLGREDGIFPYITDALLFNEIWMTEESASPSFLRRRWDASAGFTTECRVQGNSSKKTHDHCARHSNGDRTDSS